MMLSYWSSPTGARVAHVVPPTLSQARIFNVIDFFQINVLFCEKLLVNPINVTKSFLPPLGDYLYYLEKIYTTHYLTNQGPLLKQFEQEISKKFGLEYFHFITNGTVALQLALKALDICSGEVITTPFSYVATVSSILWERCTPVFVDIEPDNFTIDPEKIEEKITDETKAIMPVHVFGYACNVEAVQKIADKYGLKVIYDAAHGFGSSLNGRSLLGYGDVSTCSFHATKLFHTVEGGACIVKDKAVSENLELMKRFGHQGDAHCCLGINAKQSEFHAAMGLACLPYFDEVVEKRRYLCGLYDALLGGFVQRPKPQKGLDYNFAYYPVVFKNEGQLLNVFERLNQHQIFPRRYFYPSLNRLPYLNGYQPCPVAEDVSSRVACLPLFTDLNDDEIVKISNVVREAL